MRSISIRMLTIAGLLLAGVGQVHAGLIGGPGGSISFGALAAVPVPLAGPVGLLMLAVALAGFGLLAVRPRSEAVRSVAALLPVLGAGALAAVMLAMPPLTAQIIPDLFEVNGPGTIEFDFPESGQLDFGAVQFQNVGSAPLEITEIETECGSSGIRPPGQGDRAAAPLCEVGDEVAPQAICRVEPPDCSVIVQPLG